MKTHLYRRDTGGKRAGHREPIAAHRCGWRRPLEHGRPTGSGRQVEEERPTDIDTGAGVWWAIGAPAPVREPRSRLIERRDALLGELAPLEKQQRTGGPLPGAEEAERQRLIADLEEVYGELEAVRVRPRGGGGDVAA